MGVTLPGAAGEVLEQYEVSNSLRFNDDDSAYLSKAFSTDPSDQKLTTISFWFKIGNITSAFRALYRFNDGSNTGAVYIRNGNDLQFAWDLSSGTLDVRPDGVIRDPSAWYHFFVRVDTTQSTEADRVEIYINGVERTYSTSTYPGQNTTLKHLSNGKTYYVGGSPPNSDYYFDGYIAEFNVVDGQARSHLDFGRFDDNGVWVPKKYTGTYGNNGFYLEFKQTGTSANSSGIGADTSGNDLHWTPSNLGATDVTEDTCTNNFATLNPLDRAVENASGGIVLSEGNCEAVGVNGGNRSRAQSTIGFSSGKWYAEFKIKNGNDHKTQIGMIDEVQSTKNHGGVNAGVEYRTNDDAIYSFTNGSENSGQTGLSGISNDDIVGVAINADTSPPSIQFYVNGSTKGTAVTYPNTGSIYFFFVRDGSDSGNDEPHVVCNFGNIPSTVSSPNTDGKYGKFYYAPPSGYYALCTKRLAEFG